MELALFPLNTVLFPGSRLDLRIFEPRYLDMVRDCMRAQSPFGVCLIIAGQEAGTPATPSPHGTEARIVDFSSLPDGLLGITVEGGRRFHVDKAQVTGSGLIIAEVEAVAPPPAQPVPVEFALLVTLLERLAEQDDAELVRADKACFDDADWVGYRLAERLPISLAERQAFLEIADPVTRLQQLADWLPRFQKD